MSTSVPVSAQRNVTTPEFAAPRPGVRTSNTFAAWMDRTEARLDLSVLTGLDTDLVLGAEDASLASDMIRLDALADMLDSGFITPQDIAAGYGRAAVLADTLGLDPYRLGVAEDIEREDDADGWASDYRPAGIWPVTDAALYGDTDTELARGWAA